MHDDQQAQEEGEKEGEKIHHHSLPQGLGKQKGGQYAAELVLQTHSILTVKQGLFIILFCFFIIITIF